jgi:hypothetical protein
MTNEEAEITRVRYEDLSSSLKKIIDSLSDYDDEAFDELRLSIAQISTKINTNIHLTAGLNPPNSIIPLSSVYFNGNEQEAYIAGADGKWIKIK